MRNLGLILLGLGCVIGTYFFMFFNIGVSTGYGRTVVNEGLMNDRITGMIFGLGMAVVGGILFSKASSTKPQSAPTQPLIAPVPPPNFTVPIALAMKYQAPPGAVPSTSFPIYSAQIKPEVFKRGFGPTEAQLRYGNALNLNADQLIAHIKYIEDFKLFQHKSKLRTNPIAQILDMD